MPRPRELGQPSWPAILAATAEKAARHIHTALPGRIVSYDVATQHATIQLVIQLDGETVAPLQDVPVCWPGGASGFLHVPLSAGDNVLVIFSEEDYSKWWETGSISPPLVEQRHGLHPIAIPGLRRAAEALDVTSGHVTLAVADELRLGADDATDLVALGPAVTSQLSALKSAINGWVPVPNDGGAALKVALSSWLASSSAVAATKVKAK